MITARSFFNQEVRIVKRVNRVPYFLELIGTQQSVLHVGCADWPIFNPASNLHLQLCNYNQNVDGYDPQTETIEKMRTYPQLLNRKLYDTLPTKKYDIILAPETIEHVNNVEGFLLSIIEPATSATKIIITAPNAFSREHYTRNNNSQQTFLEIVHPDHNCWYSPYTLPNTIQKVFNSKQIPVNLIEIGTLENETMVYVVFSVKK